MTLLYLVLFLLGSFPLLITLKRIQRYQAARKRGVYTKATVTDIRTHRHARSLPHDLLTLTYHSLETGRSSTGQTATRYNKYKVGDRVNITRDPKSGKVIIPEDVAGFYPMLGFSLVLVLCIIFAIFKIREMVVVGY